jgi:hypothetical protein
MLFDRSNARRLCFQFWDCMSRYKSRTTHGRKSVDVRLRSPVCANLSMMMVSTIGRAMISMLGLETRLDWIKRSAM